METFIKFVVWTPIAWGLTLLLSLIDAFLVGVFAGWGNIEWLQDQTFGTLYWLNVAVMMPVGTAVNLALAGHEFHKEPL